MRRFNAKSTMSDGVQKLRWCLTNRTKERLKASLHLKRDYKFSPKEKAIQNWGRMHKSRFCMTNIWLSFKVTNNLQWRLLNSLLHPRCIFLDQIQIHVSYTTIKCYYKNKNGTMKFQNLVSCTRIYTTSSNRIISKKRLWESPVYLDSMY